MTMPAKAVPINRASPNQNAVNALRPNIAGQSVRSSQEVIAGAGAAAALAGIPGMYAPLAYMLPWAALDYIEMVATYNPDYSQAIDNIMTLSNPDWDIFVTGAKRSAVRIKGRIEEKSLTIQKSFGGLNGLIDKLLKQAATYGAMCGEWLISEDLTDVVDFADINPKLIRFFWEDNHWAPYQKVNFFQMQEALKSGQKIRQGNFVKLNETTFHYYAFNSYPQSPYGVPPFLAALPHISTQQDMLFNMSQVVKKVGMLGVVDIVVEQLNMMPGETVETFKARAVAYLEEYATAMEQMMTQGGIAHFDDAEVKAQSISGNAAGATAIFKQNEELLFSGLKSMPSVQGRCLDPNSLILMADGSLKKLRRIKTGDLVQGFDEMTGLNRRRWQTSKVENIWKVEKPSFRIYLSDGRSVVCSEDHPFLMQKQNTGKSIETGWSPLIADKNHLKKIAQNAAMARWHGVHDEFKGTDWRRASDIRIGEWIKAIEEPILVDFENDDYKAGYLAGANTGDGWYHLKTEKRHCVWSIAVDVADDSIIDRCESYAYDLGLPDVLHRHVVEPNKNPKSTSFAGNVQMCHLRTSRQDNVNFLTDLNKERDSIEYRAGWLAGMFDTDGNLHMKTRGREQLRFCQNDGPVKDQIERYLSDLGFTTSRCSQWIEVLGDRLERWRLTASIMPALDRKIVCLDGLTVRTFKPVQVVNIKRVGQKTLIDMTTSSKTFIANGLLTHNSYSTTETYAGVAYDIIIRNTRRYQSAVKAMMESGFWLMAAVWGETPKTLELNFKPNKTLHRLEEAKAENMEILNNVMLWVMGILDQQSVSHRMGYNEVATEIEKAPTNDPIFGHPSTSRSIDGASGGGSSTGDGPPAAGASASAGYSDEQIQQFVEEAVTEFMTLHPEYAKI